MVDKKILDTVEVLNFCANLGLFFYLLKTHHEKFKSNWQGKAGSRIKKSIATLFEIEEEEELLASSISIVGF